MGGIFSKKSISWGTNLFGHKISGEVILNWRTDDDDDELFL